MAPYTPIVVRTEQELREAVSNGAAEIEVPSGIEIVLQPVKIDRDLAEAGEAGEDDEEDADDDEMDEEAVPLAVVRDLRLFGGEGSVIRQTMCAPCGVCNVDALIVAGAHRLRLEGLIVDTGGILASEGATVSASSCTLRNGRWYAKGSGTKMNLEDCRVEGSIDSCIAVWDGAHVEADRIVLQYGGCWGPNVEVVGQGSRLALRHFTMREMEGEHVVSVGAGASAVLEHGSVEECQACAVASGTGASLALRDVALKSMREDFEVEGASRLWGVAAAAGAAVELRGGRVEQFHRAVVAGEGSEVVAFADDLPAFAENHVDWACVGDGRLLGVDAGAVRHFDPPPVDGADAGEEE